MCGECGSSEPQRGGSTRIGFSRLASDRLAVATSRRLNNGWTLLGGLATRRSLLHSTSETMSNKSSGQLKWSQFWLRSRNSRGVAQSTKPTDPALASVSGRPQWLSWRNTRLPVASFNPRSMDRDYRCWLPPEKRRNRRCRFALDILGPDTIFFRGGGCPIG